ncbi:MAG: hypothetical protein ACFFGZ_09825 [Candidatus Thorarchaeota archaeon]
MSDPYTKPKFCAICGDKFIEGAKFCGGCGAPVPSSADGPGPATVSPPGTSTRPMGWQQSTAQPPGGVAYPPPARVVYMPDRRPTGVAVITLIMIILGAFLLVMGLYMGVIITESMYNEMAKQDPQTYESVSYDDMRLVGSVMLVLGPILIIPAAFALRREAWARMATMIVLGIMGVLSIAVLWIVGILPAAGAGYSIYYLNKPEIKDYFQRRQDPYLQPPPQQRY